jgi:signal transduction histidine kinase
MAHELQNALHVISARAFLARVDAGHGECESTLVHVGVIENSARAAHAIVDDLMCLARQEAIRCDVVSLPVVFREARQDLSDRCSSWDDRIEPVDLSVRGHKTLLVRMVHALYENAIHATVSRRPMIATEARRENDDVVVDITDNGPGICPTMWDRIFEPLVTTRAEGTGLGLALARRIVRAHGGTVTLYRSDSDGTTFRLALPSA